MGEYDIIEEEKVIDEALLIDQKYWMVKESDKIEALVRLIDMSPDFYGLVFTMTKMDADNVTRALDLRGYDAAALHGDIMQNQREKVLERFRMKKTRILVATDVAARGIDISGLSHVVNYSLPFDAATYVHRIGRTGRAGAEGIAVTFVRPEERRKLNFLLKAVARASKGDIKEDKIPTVNEVLTIKEERVLKELKNKLFAAAEDEDDEKQIAAVESTETVVADVPVTEGEATDASAEVDISAENAGPKLNPVHEKFTKLAEELSENQDPKEVLAAVLSVMYGDKLSPKHYGKINAVKDFGPKGDQLRVYVSLGKRDGYRAKEIADYFSNLLHIPGRMVDQIDVAQQFALVNLPVASARKAIELSKNDKSIPHMHLDNKEEGRGSRKGGRDRDRERSGRDGGFGEERRSRGGRRDRDGGSDREGKSRREGRAKGSRPNVHSQTERNSKRGGNTNKGAAAFVKKSGKKAERF